MLRVRAGRKLDTSLRLAFLVLHNMKNVTKRSTKKRGRPATGSDPVTAIRLSDDLRTRVDQWAGMQGDKPSRSEALRRLVEAGLTVPQLSSRKKRARAEGASFAEKAAADRINRVQRGKGQSDATKAQRQEKLTQIPAEFAVTERLSTKARETQKGSSER